MMRNLSRNECKFAERTSCTYAESVIATSMCERHYLEFSILNSPVHSDVPYHCRLPSPDRGGQSAVAIVMKNAINSMISTNHITLPRIGDFLHPFGGQVTFDLHASKYNTAFLIDIWKARIFSYITPTHTTASHLLVLTRCPLYPCIHVWHLYYYTVNPLPSRETLVQTIVHSQDSWTARQSWWKVGLTLTYY